MASVNEITGDRMHSGVPSEAFKKGYDAIDWGETPQKNVEIDTEKALKETLLGLEQLRADSKRLDFIFKYELRFKRGFDFPCRIEYYGKGGDTAVEANTMRECIDLAIDMEV